MKKTDKKYLSSIKKELDKPIEMPETLSKNSIAALVAGKEQSGKKLSRKRLMRTLSAITAALAVVLSVGLYINYLNTPKPIEMPDIIANAEYPLSGNSEETIVEYFKALAVYREQNEGFKLFSAVDGALSAQVAEDSAVAGSAPGDSGIIAETYNAYAKPGSATGTTGDSDDSADFGTTNTQISTIDEEDILKNDGRYLYYLKDYYLVIIDTQTMETASSTPVNFNMDAVDFNGLYLIGDKLTVIASAWDSSGDKTFLNIYDISDRANPELIEEFAQDGQFFSSRLIGERLLLLSQKTEYCGCKAEDITYETVAPKTYSGGEEATLSSQMITIVPQEDSYSETYLIMTNVDLSEKKPDFKTSAILGSGSDIYCTSENLYITSSKNIWDETDGETVRNFRSVTEISRFSIEKGVIEFKAKGEVSGRTLNQFSLDEHSGYLRVATTNSFTESGSSNRITVLDTQLNEVAKIDGIAPGETIQSVRYIGDYGYVVTFLQTDPLFVIDFTDMENPKIAGELKIPGFSSYLHPFNGYLVGIGTDGDEAGSTNNLKISLFDISDPTKPQEIDRFILKNTWAETGHKTVMDCSNRDILGFVYGDYDSGITSFCTLKIKDGKISLIGSYNNADEEDGKQGTSYSSSGSEKLLYYSSALPTASVKRGTYIGDTLYTLSASRVCAFPLEGGECRWKADF